jgi:hypothetical protein
MDVASELATWTSLSGAGMQGVHRTLGTVLHARAEQVRFVTDSGAHRVRRVANVDALEDAGQLPVREGNL